MALDQTRNEPADPGRPLDGAYQVRLNNMANYLQIDIPDNIDLRMVMLPLLESLWQHVAWLEREHDKR